MKVERHNEKLTQVVGHHRIVAKDLLERGLTALQPIEGVFESNLHVQVHTESSRRTVRSVAIARNCNARTAGSLRFIRRLISA